MSHDTDELLVDLDATERGFVLGALLAHPTDHAALAAALEPPSDRRCGEALARLRALPRSERVRLTGQLARAAVAPIPAGLEGLDPTVLVDLLRDEPPEIGRLVTRAAPPSLREGGTAHLAVASSPDDAAPGASPEVIAELQRAVLSGLVDVPTDHKDTGADAEPWHGTVSRAPGDALARLTDLGARVLGLSLQGASGDVLLRTAALVGPPWADVILAVGRARAPGEDPGAPGADPARVPDPERERAAAVRLVASTTPAADPRETVTRVGARAAGARLVRTGARGLGGADRARALSQRLPPALGAEVLRAAGLLRPTV